MANTLGTLIGTEVVQEVLASLLVQFPLISQITRDFSGQATKFNQQLATRVVVPTTAVEHNATTGYAAVDRTTVDVTVTINKQAEASWAITDREQSQTMRDLRNEFIPTAAHALGTKILADLFATVAAASYPLSYTSSAANFDAADIRKIKTLLNKAGVPDMGNRFVCMNSDFAEGLGLDNIIVANPNGSNPGFLASGTLPRVHNFDLSEYASLPDNGEKLAGIAGAKEGIIMAARVPDIPASPDEIPGVVAIVTEPNSGLSVMFRRYYDMLLAKLTVSLTVQYGFGVGLSETGLSKRLVRIVTP